MSRMRTSLASFSWARSAIRRACSRGVRLGKGPRSLGIRVSPVEAGDLDLAGDGVWNHSRDRFAARRTFAHRRRGDIDGRDFEELDAIGALQRGEDWLEALARIAGPRRNRQAGLLEHSVGLLPREEGGELVCTDEEKRIDEIVGTERLHRARMLLEKNSCPRQRAECELREMNPVRGVQGDALVSRVADDE